MGNCHPGLEPDTPHLPPTAFTGNADPIVFDNGSGVFKAGFASDDWPGCVYPCAVGTTTCPRVLADESHMDTYVGHGVTENVGILKLDNPVDRGLIKNWDDMETIWRHTFQNELKVDPAEHPVLLSEIPMNPKVLREKMAESMFETFNVPAMYVAIQAMLSMYATGRTTGLVLDSGYGLTHSVPMFNGYALPYALKRLNIAGQDLTNYLTHILTERGIYFHTNSREATARNIKENMCYLALDLDEEKADPLETYKSKAEPETYEMPDGEIITLGNERFLCPEALFQPKLMGLDTMGVHEMIYQSVLQCDVGVKKQLYGNTILAGGTTTFPGFAHRLQVELSKKAKRKTIPKVISPAGRKYSVWVGGSILTSMSTFRELWISRQEFMEEGPGIVHRKCF